MINPPFLLGTQGAISNSTSCQTVKIRPEMMDLSPNALPPCTQLPQEQSVFPLPGSKAHHRAARLRSAHETPKTCPSFLPKTYSSPPTTEANDEQSTLNHDRPQSKAGPGGVGLIRFGYLHKYAPRNHATTQPRSHAANQPDREV